MSQPKYCQGPSCHEYKTKDRIRGSKGDKHYETRKRCHLAYGNHNFCSLGCQDDWFRKFGNRAIDHFGRIHEPKRQAASAFIPKLRRNGANSSSQIIASNETETHLWVRRSKSPRESKCTACEQYE